MRGLIEAMTSPRRSLAYTMEGTMRELHISRAKLYELIQKQKLRTYKTGRRRYCTHDAIIECQRLLEGETPAL